MLSTLLYGSTSLRQSGDLDILVDKKDCLRAKELLLSRTCSRRLRLEDDQSADSLVSDCEHHFLLSREDDRLLVELHWDLIQPCYSIQFEFQNIARRLEFLPVSGCRVPSIDRETLVLFLCVHGAKHSWGRLGWVCDVAELIRPERGVVWESVIEQACQLHCVRILHLGLILAEKILARHRRKLFCGGSETMPRLIS